jgi:hypothetical protein
MRRISRAVAALVCATVALSACGDNSLGSVGLYDRAPVPFVPDRTEQLEPDPEPLLDGYYWAELVGPIGTDQLRFELTQAFFASACEEEFGADACVQGFAVVATNPRTVDASVATIGIVSVVAETRQNYAVTAEELWRLVSGESPDERASDTYAYRPYPFLVSVAAGVVTEVRQIWLAPPT